MKHSRLNRLFLVIIAILVVALIGLTGCTESAGSSIVVPTFTELGPPPIEVTVEQLYQEYLADETAADAKYKGERLIFNEVEVEEVVRVLDYGGGMVDYYVYWVANYPVISIEDGMALDVIFKTHFIIGFVKFRLRGEYYGIMQNIEEGYVLNIVGECQGLFQSGFIIIDDCWVESVIGDLVGKGDQSIDY